MNLRSVRASLVVAWVRGTTWFCQNALPLARRRWSPWVSRNSGARSSQRSVLGGCPHCVPRRTRVRVPWPCPVATVPPLLPRPCGTAALRRISADAATSLRGYCSKEELMSNNSTITSLELLASTGSAIPNGGSRWKVPLENMKLRRPGR